MNIPCIKCKGSTPMQSCGRSFCPIIARSDAISRVKPMLAKQDFFGSSPAVFVGHFGYPNVNVGILSPPEKTEEAWMYDCPDHWSKNNFGIQRIIGFRSSLINSRFRSNVKDKGKLLEISREIGMSSSPVDVEINMKDKPRFRINQSPYIAPTGPNSSLKKARITENPKIHTKVDKVVSDTDLKAKDALLYLYNSEFDDNFLSKALSIGNLGMKKSRKLVPLRWSITATHDTIAKSLMGEVKQFKSCDYMSFFGSYLGNYYLILMFPEEYSYELFETYMPKAEWNISDKAQYMTDYEPYGGRKSYAENCGGGFYSVRLGILEKLKDMKRQASVLALRFITGEYAAPLGVWVTLAAARKALSNKPIEFASKELMLNYARLLARKKFGYEAESLLNKSVLLRRLKTQKKLAQFI
ncbi:hypothetical protein KY358_00515 [Candidatus Woesearchaeota archaeon]|nr:hypothetical protein [Candidatus Woesearchaeota archaeon]